MGVYGTVAVRAWQLASCDGMAPSAAWSAALEERFPEEDQLESATKHTCMKNAFVSLCQNGCLRDIDGDEYVPTVTGGYALAAVRLLQTEPNLTRRKSELKRRVMGDRKESRELDVVLTLWEQGLLR
jgi:hypothetical protein